MDLPPCGPGVLQCWVVPSVSGTYTVSARVRRLPITADAAVQVTGDQHLAFENFSGGGGGVVASRGVVTPKGALRSAVEAPASLTVRIKPSERIGILGNPVFSTKQFRAIVTDGLGRRVPNVDVKLSLSAHELTGGHEHSDLRFPKDPGIFGTQEGNKGDTLKTVNTGPTTDGAIFTYRAPDPAGLVTVHGLVGTNVRATLDVDVGVDSLEQLTEARLFNTVGQAYHHADRFWVSKGEKSKLKKVADSLLVEFANETMPQDVVRRLSVNDASLPNGGQFDIFGGVDRGGASRASTGSRRMAIIAAARGWTFASPTRRTIR